MAVQNFLASAIYVSRRFQRSIKLDSDITQADALEGFILQDSNEECLSMMAHYLKETDQRAFTWTGSYGSGKSALALFLCSLLGADVQLREAAQAILRTDPKKTKAIRQTFSPKKPYRIVTMIGHNGHLPADFIQAVCPTAKDAREAINAVVEEAQQNPEGGVCIVIDELGKYLEGGNSDNCYFLQELAEAVNRAKAPILVLGILHQAFDAYANKLSKAQRDEWAKVQGRYVDIPLLSAADEVLRLLDKSICESEGFIAPDFSDAIANVVNELGKSRRIDRESFESTLTGVYPLNPVSACLLGTITRQSFLQNTRSVFNFLTSQEPFGFNAFLQGTPVEPKTALYAPDTLWDYLQTNFEHAIRATASKSHRWAIACDCIERAESLDVPYLSRIVKTIAVLDLFKAGTGLESSVQVLCAALWPLNTETVVAALTRLTEEKIIVYRKYLNAYTLFEGSDFNLEEAINDALTQIDEIDVGVLRRTLKLTPVIARRHYAQSGTMRWFSRELCNWQDLKAYLKKPEDTRAAGRLILVFTPQRSLEKAEIEEGLRVIDDPSLFVGVVGAGSSLIEAGKEMMALEIVSKDPALEGDAVARQELALRRENVTSTLICQLQEIFDHMTWYAPRCDGKTVNSAASLNSMLSDSCQKIFYAAPPINNELINREQLSSNITHAMKQLINRMVYNGTEFDLGFEPKTFPPEKMIYRSILRDCGLHRQKQKGDNWIFVTDTTTERTQPFGRYAALWRGTDAFFQGNEKPSLQELYDYWSKPPFGIKAGVRPILAMAYFLANSNCLSVYLRESFEPDLNEEIVLTWFNDPREVKFRYVKSNTERSALLDRLYDALKPLAGCIEDKTPLAVARAIVRIVLTCPKWALNTSQLSEETKEFRTAVIKAWDPLALVFKALPTIFRSNDVDVIVSKTITALKEIRDVTPQMLDRVRSFLLKALDATEEPEKIPERAKAVRGLAGQIKLEAFVTRLSVYRSNYASIEGIISLAVAKPKPQWTDRDIDMCMTKLNEWALSFRHLESMGTLMNRPSGRRIISIVVGGEHGQSQAQLDLPASTSPAVEKAKMRLAALLKEFPEKVALAALIEQSQTILEKDK